MNVKAKGELDGALVALHALGHPVRFQGRFGDGVALFQVDAQGTNLVPGEYPLTRSGFVALWKERDEMYKKLNTAHDLRPAPRPGAAPEETENSPIIGQSDQETYEWGRVQGALTVLKEMAFQLHNRGGFDGHPLWWDAGLFGMKPLLWCGRLWVHYLSWGGGEETFVNPDSYKHHLTQDGIRGLWEEYKELSLRYQYRNVCYTSSPFRSPLQ